MIIASSLSIDNYAIFIVFISRRKNVRIVKPFRSKVVQYNIFKHIKLTNITWIAILVVITSAHCILDKVQCAIRVHITSTKVEIDGINRLKFRQSLLKIKQVRLRPVNGKVVVFVFEVNYLEFVNKIWKSLFNC